MERSLRPAYETGTPVRTQTLSGTTRSPQRGSTWSNLHLGSHQETRTCSLGFSSLGDKRSDSTLVLSEASVRPSAASCSSTDVCVREVGLQILFITPPDSILLDAGTVAGLCLSLLQIECFILLLIDDCEF